MLDDIIVARYLGWHPALGAVADVAEGRYAIALRPGDDDCARRSTARSAS